MAGINDQIRNNTLLAMLMQQQGKRETLSDPAPKVQEMPAAVEELTEAEDLPLAEAGPVIGEIEIRQAQELLKKYQAGKENLDNKLIENEDWWKLKHNRRMKKQGDGETTVRSTSAWLFNSVMNKHADFMDNYPEASVLPRERSDEQAAKMLGEILPVVLENAHFEDTYSSAAWDKLKNGSSVYGVFWNTELLNGLGDIDIRNIDMLQLYWEPGIQNIQESRNLFLLTLEDNDLLVEKYPQLKGKLTGSPIEVKEYHFDDTVDTSGKSVVVDWYYKKNNGRCDVLHFVKYVGNEILYASENDNAHPEYAENGFYSHGKYPFVMDVLFEERGTPAGFGYIDVMKGPQTYIDELSESIMENAQWAATPRFFASDQTDVNLEDFLDKGKKIVKTVGNPSEDRIRQIQVDAISGTYLSILQDKVNELKETSGNRDFSQGATTSGVTAASAISMLVETGSKGSRDMIRGAYRAFTEICNICIELMRQFYTEPRTFRIVGEDGVTSFVDFSSASLNAAATVSTGLDLKARVPVFDIKVRAQKSNPYSRLSQNELALQFFDKGFFNPQMADQALAVTDMMDFEGKAKTEEKIRENGTMYQKILQLQDSLIKVSAMYAKKTGDTRFLQAAQIAAGQGSQPMPPGGSSEMPVDTDSLGSALRTGNTIGDRARMQAREASAVR